MPAMDDEITFCEVDGTAQLRMLDKIATGNDNKPPNQGCMMAAEGASNFYSELLAALRKAHMHGTDRVVIRFVPRGECAEDHRV